MKNWSNDYPSFVKDDGLLRDKAISTDAAGTHQLRASSGAAAARSVVSGAATLIGPLAPGEYEIVCVNNAAKDGATPPDNLVWLQGNDNSLAVTATSGQFWRCFDDPTPLKLSVPSHTGPNENANPNADKRLGAFLSFIALGSKTNLLSIRRVRTA